MNQSMRLMIVTLGSALVAACANGSMRAGQSATVQFGVVSSAQSVTLDSSAVDGAVIGGMLGLAAPRGGGSSRRTQGAIIGASIGGAASAAAQGSRTGMQYIVQLLDGSLARIVTDQTQIREGDCVAVERVRGTANIRRTSESFCDPANRAVIPSVESTLEADAAACERAKREFAEATDSAELYLATRRVELMCNG